MAKTGGHFERCNVGSVEAHNERTRDYLEKVKASGKSLYFFQNLTVNNTHWANGRQEFAGKTCAQIFESLKQLYTEKTGQAPQLKDRKRINKKTGKEYTIAGWSPIREAVIPIKEDTTVEDFKPVFDWLRRNGLEPIRLDLHKDEGYENQETGERKMNYHAHLVVCWVDLQTGRTANLKKDKMSEFNQKVLPEALHMEAGESKNITAAKHLRPEEYKSMMDAKRQADNQVSAAKKAQADAEKKTIQKETELIRVTAAVDRQTEKLKEQSSTLEQQQVTISDNQAQIDQQQKKLRKLTNGSMFDKMFHSGLTSEVKKAFEEKDEQHKQEMRQATMATYPNGNPIVWGGGKKKGIQLTWEEYAKWLRDHYKKEIANKQEEIEQAKAEAKRLRVNIDNLKEQHKNELGNRDNIIYRRWPEVHDAVAAIFQLGNSPTARDFTPQQALHVEKAIALSGTERTDAAKDLLSLAQKDFDNHRTPQAWVDGAAKVVNSIAQGTHQRLKALLNQQSKDAGGGTSYITDLTDWAGNQIHR